MFEGTCLVVALRTSPDAGESPRVTKYLPALRNVRATARNLP